MEMTRRAAMTSIAAGAAVVATTALPAEAMPVAAPPPYDQNPCRCVHWESDEALLTTIDIGVAFRMADKALKLPVDGWIEMRGLEYDALRRRNMVTETMHGATFLGRSIALTATTYPFCLRDP